ncbi:hypothetical protein ACFFQF_06330 [Haladaptatus pallidirubidus]|uniref:DUF7563 family protein n=1 Tax=Haladaptatus pallidirubidus TaxID=1008152 RepID=UPI0035EC50BF
MDESPPECYREWLGEDNSDHEAEPRCACSEEVSLQFARVFGDNDNEVFACRACSSLSERQKVMRSYR